jgi:hypothetical protein
MSGIGAALTILLASLVPLATDSIPLEVQGEGYAAGLGPAARAEAIRVAQTAIIIQRLETLAPNRDFALFAPMLEQPERFVPSYRVIDEETTDNATHVEIAGQLLDAELKRNAAALILHSRADKPRVILIISERISPGTPRSFQDEGVAESAIAEKLEEAKFEVMDSRQLLSANTEDELRQYLGGSPSLASQLARRELADVAILGSAASFIEAGNSKNAGLRRHRAELDLRVIRAADGYILEEIESAAELISVDSGQGGVLSVKDACEKISDPLINAAALGLLGGAPQNQIYLTIEGLGGGEQLEQILKRIKTVPGVESVDEMYTTDEMARMAIAYSGPMGPFVDALSANRYDGYFLHTESVVNRDMTVSVRH